MKTTKMTYASRSEATKAIRDLKFRRRRVAKEASRVRRQRHRSQASKLAIVAKCREMYDTYTRDLATAVEYRDSFNDIQLPGQGV